MDYPHFLTELPSLYNHWGNDAVCPKSDRFQQVLNQVQGMTTTNVMQLLNAAVVCLEPNEIYCETVIDRG